MEKQYHEMNFFMPGITSSVFPETHSPSPTNVHPWCYGSNSVMEQFRVPCSEKQLEMVGFVPFCTNSASSDLSSAFFLEGISGSSGNLRDDFHRSSKKIKYPKLEQEDETYLNPRVCLLDELKLHYTAPPHLVPPHLTRTSERLSRLAAKDEIARQRRRRLAEKFGTLQRLMPWKSKMDTATMLEEATKYVKFLEAQVRTLSWMPLVTDPSPSRQQLLQVMVNSSALQTQLYSNGWCVFSAEQVELLKFVQMKRTVLLCSYFK